MNLTKKSMITILAIVFIVIGGGLLIMNRNSNKVASDIIQNPESKKSEKRTIHYPDFDLVVLGPKKWTPEEEEESREGANRIGLDIGDVVGHPPITMFQILTKDGKLVTELQVENLPYRRVSFSVNGKDFTLYSDMTIKDAEGKKYKEINTSYKTAVSDLSQPTAEMKAQAIKMFIKSRALYEADNLLGILTYVEETNDPGELDDFKTQTGLSVADAKKALEKSPRDPSKPNASNAKLVQMMSFISEDFFNKMPNVNWQVTKNADTGSTDVLAEFENIVTINSAGDTRLAMCLLGATQQKDGTWRALPIAAFRCE